MACPSCHLMVIIVFYSQKSGTVCPHHLGSATYSERATPASLSWISYCFWYPNVGAILKESNVLLGTFRTEERRRVSLLMILLPFYRRFYSHSTDDSTPILLMISIPILLLLLLPIHRWFYSHSTPFYWWLPIWKKPLHLSRLAFFLNWQENGTPENPLLRLLSHCTTL